MIKKTAIAAMFLVLLSTNVSAQANAQNASQDDLAKIISPEHILEVAQRLAQLKKENNGDAQKALAAFAKTLQPASPDSLAKWIIEKYNEWKKYRIQVKLTPEGLVPKYNNYNGFMPQTFDEKLCGGGSGQIYEFNGEICDPDVEAWEGSVFRDTEGKWHKEFGLKYYRQRTYSMYKRSDGSWDYACYDDGKRYIMIGIIDTRFGIETNIPAKGVSGPLHWTSDYYRFAICHYDKSTKQLESDCFRTIDYLGGHPLLYKFAWDGINVNPHTNVPEDIVKQQKVGRQWDIGDSLGIDTGVPQPEIRNGSGDIFIISDFPEYRLARELSLSAHTKNRADIYYNIGGPDHLACTEDGRMVLPSGRIVAPGTQLVRPEDIVRNPERHGDKDAPDYCVNCLKWALGES